MLSTFPRISGLQSVPINDIASLDTNHVFICVVGSEIRHRLALFFPRIPDHHIRKHISRHLEAGFVFFGHHDFECSILGVVNAICFLGDGERFRIRGFLLVRDLVVVRSLFQAFDGDIVDALDALMCKLVIPAYLAGRAVLAFI